MFTMCKNAHELYAQRVHDLYNDYRQKRGGIMIEGDLEFTIRNVLFVAQHSNTEEG
jgi:hypothetical protein